MIKQIHLYCRYCSKKLDVAAYAKYFYRPRVICLYCGNALICCDIDYPNYRKALDDKIALEQKIRSLCALTGRTVSEIEALVSEQNLSLADLDYLIEQIAKGEKKIDDN